MKVITLWQPWASWVALGWKTIETRTHPRFACLVGQRIAIHAGLKWDDTALTAAKDFLTATQRGEVVWGRERGVIICTAYVAAHRELDSSHSKAALIDCGGTRRWGLFLTDVQVVKAFPVKGKQGIWSVEL
jgi:hypothetical protein